MKRYVPTGAMGENCDLENHRSKLRVCQFDDKTTEDESEEDHTKPENSKIKKLEDKEGKKGSKDTKKEIGKSDNHVEDVRAKDAGREDKSDKSRVTVDREKMKDTEQQPDGKNGKEHKKCEEKLDKTKRPEQVNKDSRKMDDKYDRSKKIDEGRRELKHGDEKVKIDRSDKSLETKREGKQRSKDNDSKLKGERPNEDVKPERIKENLKSDECNGVEKEEEPLGKNGETIENKTFSPKLEVSEKRQKNFEDDAKDHKGKREENKSRSKRLKIK